MGPYVVLCIIIILAVFLLATNIRVVPQAHAYIVERLGGYQTTWNVGLHFKMPLIDKVAGHVVLKEQVADFDPQPVITKDNVTMSIDTVVFFQITDPKLYTYGVVNPMSAIENLTATTLRNIIGDLELDETLTSRETINTRMRSTLDIATDPWGIKVTRVELKNIMPPAAIQEAMEKQMKAEREKRAVILAAEGEKQAAITRAEGEKESAILRADADREERIRTAQGEAEAIRAVAQAQANAIEMINSARPSSEYLSIRSMEAAEKMADGQATKIVVPSSLQDVASLATVFRETK